VKNGAVFCYSHSIVSKLTGSFDIEEHRCHTFQGAVSWELLFVLSLFHKFRCKDICILNAHVWMLEFDFEAKKVYTNVKNVRLRKSIATHQRNKE
jgi:hypothetical protein